MLCLFGGRYTQPIDCYDPNTTAWTRSNTTTDDVHHVQPVVWRDEVWIVAGWHGPFPDGERHIKSVLVYDPRADALREECAIPDEFGRGAAGVVVHDDVMYIVNGARNGHEKADGAYAYRNFTRFDPATCAWAQMPARP